MRSGNGRGRGRSRLRAEQSANCACFQCQRMQRVAVKSEGLVRVPWREWSGGGCGCGGVAEDVRAVGIENDTQGPGRNEHSLAAATKSGESQGRERW